MNFVNWIWENNCYFCQSYAEKNHICRQSLTRKIVNWSLKENHEFHQLVVKKNMNFMSWLLKKNCYFCLSYTEKITSAIAHGGENHEFPQLVIKEYHEFLQSVVKKKVTNFVNQPSKKNHEFFQSVVEKNC